MNRTDHRFSQANSIGLPCLLGLLLAGCSPAVSPSVPEPEPEPSDVVVAFDQPLSLTDSGNPSPVVESDSPAEVAGSVPQPDLRVEPERVKLSDSPAVDRFGRLELTFDNLSFEMEKGDDFERSMLTEEIESYHGAEIRLRGYIRPSFRQSGISKFVFVRDNKECCFGPGASLYDCVLVKLAKGVDTEYTVRPIVVTGKFYLKEYQGPDGRVWSIYQLKSGRIE